MSNKTEEQTSAELHIFLVRQRARIIKMLQETEEALDESAKRGHKRIKRLTRRRK